MTVTQPTWSARICGGIARNASLRHLLYAAELLERWDDPFCFEEFRFRMPLAGPLPASQCSLFQAQLARAFGALAQDRVELDAVSLMRQDDPAGRFHVLSRRRLTGR